MLSSCCLVALAGCAMIPDYVRPAAPVSRGYPGISETKEAHIADIGWRDFIAEERLQKVVELALENNRDLRIAVLKVEQSRAQYRIARSASFPEISAGGAYTRSGDFHVSSDQWSASVGMTSYEVDLFGRVHSLNRQALEKYFATDEARRSTQISLVAEVATQYFALREAEEQLALARNTLKTVQDSYSLNKATFDAGAINELDLRTAEGQVETARINVLTFERQRSQVENALVLLIGQSLPADLPNTRAFGETNLLAGDFARNALRTHSTSRRHIAGRTHFEGGEREHRGSPSGVLSAHHPHQFSGNDQ